MNQITQQGRPDWSVLKQAIAWAIDLHARQVRKGVDTPYIAHLLQVAGIVLEYGGDQDQAVAAMLHDAIEDQGVTEQEIASRFGDRVAAIVAGCTDARTLPKPPWQARKDAYIASLEHKAPEILFVSCADKLHNLRTILADYRTAGEAVFDRFSAGKSGTLWYYRELAQTYAALLPGPISGELTHTYLALESEMAR